jgi:Tol biopolymer transport system component
VTFAHSGKQFAYVHRLASSQLYSAPFSIDKGIDLEHRLQLTAGERIVREPSASPDGKWIAVRVQDPQEDLAIIHPDGSDFHRITNDAFADRGPHWSPDGKEIVFLSNRSDNTQFQVWSIHPDGTGLKQLTQHGPVSNAWTPDGTLVAFPGTGKPFALEHPGKPLVNWELPDIFRPIAWSPDGKSVVGRMRSNAFGQAALFVLSPGASDFWQIATNAPYTSVAWLQDGSHLLFSGDDGIHLADIGSHTLRAEPINLQGQIHSRFAASRDGSSLYFVVSDDEEDIWTASE